MLGCVVAANLEVASVLSKAQIENSFGYNASVNHGVKYRPLVHSFSPASILHSQDAIGLLIIEKSCFFLYAPKCEVEPILRVEVLTKI
jgi:hypothetical protein